MVRCQLAIRRHGNVQQGLKQPFIQLHEESIHTGRKGNWQIETILLKWKEQKSSQLYIINTETKWKKRNPGQTSFQPIGITLEHTCAYTYASIQKVWITFCANILRIYGLPNFQRDTNMVCYEVLTKEQNCHKQKSKFITRFFADK